MAVPVLTYHGVNVHANTYAGNDHIALAADLRLIHQLGRRIVPLETIARWVRGEVEPAAVAGGVGLSFDDGAWFDWHDLDHPSCGPQRSMAGILRDFMAETGHTVHATSFVIASADARKQLDRTCLIGRGWWGDEWWAGAVDEGILALGNHSWDHLHPTLEAVAHSRGEKGSFLAVDNAADAEAQIARANEYIAATGGRAPRLFAYPCGQASDYVAEQYLPARAAALGLIAAFTTRPRAVHRTDDPWRLPRFTCGQDWRSGDELAALLARVRA